MNFEFATSGRIIFGAGTVAQAGPAAAQMGARALVAVGAPDEVTAVLFDTLAQHNICLLYTSELPTSDLV